MFVESSVVDVCKSVCMCLCFETDDSCGFIRLVLHLSTSGMCVPIGYFSLGGVERCQQNSKLARLVYLVACIIISRGFSITHNLLNKSM